MGIIMLDKSDVKYYLGIDWGRVQCGLALAENENKIASGFGEFKREELMKKVRELSSEYNLERVVVGFPRHLNLNENEIYIEKLKERIEKLGLEVDLEDESFSSRLAQENLSQTNKRNISKNDNVEAARIILQGWLDKRA